MRHPMTVKVLRQRYKVLSEIGVFRLKEFIRIFEEKHDYWEATKQFESEWWKNQPKVYKRLIKAEWKP